MNETSWGEKELQFAEAGAALVISTGFCIGLYVAAVYFKFIKFFVASGIFWMIVLPILLLSTVVIRHFRDDLKLGLVDVLTLPVVGLILIGMIVPPIGETGPITGLALYPYVFVVLPAVIGRFGLTLYQAAI